MGASLPPRPSSLPEQLCVVVLPVTPLDVVKIRLQAQQTPFYKGGSVLVLGLLCYR